MVRKKWVVAIFVQSRDYSVIPINWLDHLVEDEDSLLDVEYCRWPKKNIISDDLIEAVEPNGLWDMYEIRIVHNEIFTDFKYAWYKQVELENNIQITADDLEPITNDTRISKKQFDREPLTITEILSTSTIDYSQIGDGSVSLSPVPKRKNTKTLDLTSKISKTRSSTHLIIRRLSPRVEMVDLPEARSSAAIPGARAKKNGSVSLSPVPKRENTETLNLTSKTSMISKTQSSTHLMIRSLSPDVEMVDLQEAHSSAAIPGARAKKNGSVSLSPVPKRENTETLDLISKTSMISKTQSSTHLMIRRLSPDVEMVDLQEAQSSAAIPGASAKKSKKRELYMNNKQTETNNKENNK